jgi:tocopherol O-methyltransferase
MVTISTRAIRAHYDRLSLFYRWFWGDHIHHGFWRNGETPREAQLNLVKELAWRANIDRHEDVLDIGCGLGGSAIWLAQELDCLVIGITISPVQKWLADKRANALGLGQRVKFQVADANRLEIGDREFNVIWVIESSEHLFDKRAFVFECARLLQPGGRLALCSWLAGDSSSSADRDLISNICSGMLCPSLATFSEYKGWIAESGLQLRSAEEVPSRVTKTWQYCQQMVEAPVVRVFLPLLGRHLREFTAQFPAMLRGYQYGALSYGIFVALKR